MYLEVYYNDLSKQIFTIGNLYNDIPIPNLCRYFSNQRILKMYLIVKSYPTIGVKI